MPGKQATHPACWLGPNRVVQKAVHHLPLIRLDARQAQPRAAAAKPTLGLANARSSLIYFQMAIPPTEQPFAAVRRWFGEHREWWGEGYDCSVS